MPMLFLAASANPLANTYLRIFSESVAYLISLLMPACRFREYGQSLSVLESLG
ncbi:hypothetical protein VCHE45_1960 [Vibrio cholerae HE-45]|nr:hypothetical protein VCHE45_1960 [Vibrio cholerae HE-45]